GGLPRRSDSRGRHPRLGYRCRLCLYRVPTNLPLCGARAAWPGTRAVHSYTVGGYWSRRLAVSPRVSGWLIVSTVGPLRVWGWGQYPRVIAVTSRDCAEFPPCFRNCSTND